MMSLLDDVQFAIWHEEEEITTLSGSDLDFYNDQQALFAASGWTGLGNVRVINLTDEGETTGKTYLSPPLPFQNRLPCYF